MAESAKTKNQIDMTSGSLADKIFKFAVPLALTGMLQQVFNSADTAVVGRFVGKTAMAAVGSNSAIVGLLVNLFLGVSLGANVVIAHFTGQRNREGVKKGVHTAICVSFLSGIIVAALGLLLSKPVLGLISVPSDVYPMALDYLRIYVCGIPVIFLYDFESAIFRSQGDTKTPLFCLIIAGVLNVFLNLFFVIVVHMTADGVALATVISNCVSSALLFVILCRQKSDIRVIPKDLKIDFKIFARMFQIGMPAGLQGMVFSFSNICVQSAINSLGSVVMAASSAAFNIEAFVYFVFNAFGQATTTFVGQNTGAGKPDRCKRVIKDASFEALILTAVFSGLLMIFATPVLKIFNTDPQVLSYGRIRLYYILSWELLNAMMEIFSGALRGFGYSLVPALLTLFGVCGTRIIWVFVVFRRSSTFTTLLWCYPISWVITFSAILVYYLFMRKRLFRPQTGND